MIAHLKTLRSVEDQELVERQRIDLKVVRLGKVNGKGKYLCRTIGQAVLPDRFRKIVTPDKSLSTDLGVHRNKV